jgi:uncharacterized repeat protein (TIGR01451 family)
VSVVGAEGLRGAAEACVTGVPPGAVQSAPPETPPLSSSPSQPPAGVPPQSVPQTPPPRIQPPRATPPQAVPPAAPQGRPAVSIEKSGPAVQSVGAVAEFFIDVQNTGDVELTNLTVTDVFDPRLQPLQATDGYALVNENLVWKLPSLPPGRSLRLQVNFRCGEAAARVSNRVQVTSAEGATDQTEISLEIRRPQSQLSLNVAAHTDPVALGKDVTYEIQVTNSGNVPAQNVALLAVLPKELSLVRVGTRGPAGFGVDDQEVQLVRFLPVASLEPGQTLTYRVTGRANQTGDVRFEVRLTSAGQAEPLQAEETTLIVDRP